MMKSLGSSLAFSKNRAPWVVRRFPLLSPTAGINLDPPLHYLGAAGTTAPLDDRYMQGDREHY
jgi:hypothetical protein